MKTVRLTHPHQLNKNELDRTVMGLGFFDGVHLGHQKVIYQAKQIANENNLKCAVMTFSPHPKEILTNAHVPMNYITPLPDKIKLISELGIDTLYIIEFTKEFANLTPQQFVDDYMINLHVVHVVAGFDYTYGKLGKGTMETLKFHSRNQFDYTVVSKLEKTDKKVSSTNIRKLLSIGQLDHVHEFLGRNYTIKGKVVNGEKRGRTIGFPTANIERTEKYLLPMTGVYTVRMKIDDCWVNGVCSIGYKPTFHLQLLEATIEVHLFNFNEDIYEKDVIIEFISFIRGERKFASVDELIEQIEEDCKEAQRILEN